MKEALKLLAEEALSGAFFDGIVPFVKEHFLSDDDSEEDDSEGD